MDAGEPHPEPKVAGQTPDPPPISLHGPPADSPSHAQPATPSRTVQPPGYVVPGALHPLSYPGPGVPAPVFPVVQPSASAWPGPGVPQVVPVPAPWGPMPHPPERPYVLPAVVIGVVFLFLFAVFGSIYADPGAGLVLALVVTVVAGIPLFLVARRRHQAAMTLGAGFGPAVGGPLVTGPPVAFSPDGRYWWDGVGWRPTGR